MFGRFEVFGLTMVGSLGATCGFKSERGIPADALQMRLRSIFDFEVPFGLIFNRFGIVFYSMLISFREPFGTSKSI